MERGLLYLIAIPILLSLLLLTVSVGRRLTEWLPAPIRCSLEFYVAPLVGLGVLILVATLCGWLLPFRTDMTMATGAGLLLLSIAFEPRRRELLLDWLTVSAFALVATLPIFASAIRFDSFNPFNDTFTYLVHGQWLQQHAFSEAARASGYFPAETQVHLYQVAGHRMGSSFFLGFVQSLYHLEWSYYAFLPTVAVAFTTGCLAVGGVIRQALPLSRKVCLALAALPAISMNGFVFGAQYGFFPQTFGLAFAAGLACMVPAYTAWLLRERPGVAAQLVGLFPLAVCCAALLFAYNDMFTALGAGIAVYLVLVCMLHWEEKWRIAGPVLLLAAQVMILVNVEGVRILRNLLGVVGAVSGAVPFGWQVFWSPIQFVAFSFGMKSPFQRDLIWVDGAVSTWLFPVLLVAMIAIAVRLARSRQRNFAILFIAAVNFVFWLAYAKFRYATPGVGEEVGHTFLQFKIAKWLAPFNLALLGIAFAWVLLKARRYRRAGIFLFVVSAAAGLAINFLVVAQVQVRQLQEETQRARSSFNVFLELREKVARIPKEQVIYVAVDAEHHKVTQMVAYALYDRRLASKYADGYLMHHMPPEERDMPIAYADWIIQLKPVTAKNEDPELRVGPFLLRHSPY